MVVSLPSELYFLARVFPRPFRHGGTSAGRQNVNGGTHEGDIDIVGGPNFDRLYHKLKVLLLLLLLLLLLCY